MSIIQGQNLNCNKKEWRMSCILLCGVTLHQLGCQQVFLCMALLSHLASTAEITVMEM